MPYSPRRTADPFASSYASARSAASGVSTKSSQARLFAQRAPLLASTLSDDVHDSVRESEWDTSLHLVRRQQPWNSHQTGVQVAWRTHTSYDRLNWNLEPHPPWIAKAPGTYGSTFERNLTYDYQSPSAPNSARRPFTAEWDPRFLVSFSLSNDPVLNGHRKGLNNRRGTALPNLSPTRDWVHR